MNIKTLAEKLKLKVVTDNNGIENEISDVYVGDLLSRVMAKAQVGSVWITIHTHQNIAAVALLTELSCIILPEGMEPEQDTILKANENNICIMSSNMSAYKLCVEISKVLECR